MAAPAARSRSSAMARNARPAPPRTRIAGPRIVASRSSTRRSKSGSMRRFIMATTLAAALVAAAPAFAQRVSLADRVAALEQQAANNQGNVDLLNQVTQLKSEVQALRSQLEELQQQQEQARQASRNQYLDLDGRLNRLEGGAASPPAATSV